MKYGVFREACLNGRRLTGVIHLTRSISARQRWCKSHEIDSAVISHIYDVTGYTVCKR